ncbi:hypothetical protein HN385_02540 [archaeon]|jgi:hypothetical protein|nr:hypothetical protein [archaeon]MBT3450796.1 hypothetical protein [archaeon]MBT6868791.1 hypothetical protein [archaeon]MBT7192988.1 hypothetical protein [archaeon]MBT7380954.1 hypothetical protein [archaeon]
MKVQPKDIIILILKIVASLALILIFGIIGLILGATIGGNYGCSPIIDSIFDMKGYESCGMLFSLVSMTLGVILVIYANIKLIKK